MSVKNNMTWIFIFFANFVFCQAQNESIVVKPIQEIVIVKNKPNPFEKKLNIKWSLKENEELVSFIKNDRNRDESIRSIRFKLVNISNHRQSIIFKMYDNRADLPHQLVYEKNIILEPKEEVNQILFHQDNFLLKKEGVFVGFSFQKENHGKVYVFTKQTKEPQTYVKKKNVWEKFSPEKNDVLSQLYKVNIYFKMK